MFKEKDDTYIVTHMINPSHFYLHDPRRRNATLLRIVEENVRKEIAMKQEEHPDLHKQFEKVIKKGDIVAYYWNEGKRFIRCEVDGVSRGYFSTYFLFALDYGVPLYTTNFQLIYNISDVLKYIKTSIIGPIGLDVLPAVTQFDILEQKELIVYKKQWLEIAVSSFQAHVNNAVIIKFVPSTKMTSYRNFWFGDLLLTLSCGTEYSLCDALIHEKFAKSPENDVDFYRRFGRSSVFWTERWNNNERSGGILRSHDQNVIPFSFERELVKKQMMRRHALDSIQRCAKKSIIKVLEWKEKIKGYEKCIPDTEELREEDEENCESVINEVWPKLTAQSDISDRFTSVSQVESNVWVQEEKW